MQYFLTAFLLLASFLFWGTGLAAWVTPARYRRFSLIFAAPAGLALQSLTVWIGAHAGLKGTDAYGRLSLILPLVLLLAAWLWRREAWRKSAGFSVLLALMTIQLGVMVLPFALRGGDLTTVSTGSHDAADYAAGARVFQEFSSSDRSGFIGQTEVVSVGVVDNFFDFWLRTNHFTPSALIALNGSILGLKPCQLTGLITIVLLTATLPMVFWLARAGLRYRPWPSLGITAIYAFSPINWYAVYQVSPAQIIAANAIALLTWCGLAYWRENAVLTRSWRWTGLLFTGFGLVFGAYNFMIVVCLVPLVAYVGGLAVRKRLWTQLTRWFVVMIGLLVVSGLVYFERGAGVIERLTLFEQGFGWAISLLTPEGWLGLLDGPWLGGFALGWRIPLAVGAAALIIVPLLFGARRRPLVVWLTLSLSLPILAGYWYLRSRVPASDSTSYEAYKLFAVFYPGMLAAYCFWADLGWRNAGARRWLTGLGLVGLIVANFAGEWRLFYRLQAPLLEVDAGMVSLGKIEAMPQVSSVNMRLENGWARLWANAFLLRKPQYFEIHTYEGRKSTALSGEWDLLGDFFQFDLPGDDTLHPAPGYTLMRRQSPCFIEAAMGGGWAEMVRDDPRPARRTHWAAYPNPYLILHNPQPVPLRVTLRAVLRALGNRECQIKLGGVELAQLSLSQEPQIWTKADLVLSPGETRVDFFTPQPSDNVGGRLKHPVTFAIDGFDIQVLGRVGGSVSAQ